MGNFFDEGPVEERSMVCFQCIYPYEEALIATLRTDTKSVAIISSGCFYPIVKVQSAALHFFIDEEEENNSEDEEEVSFVCALIV